MGRVVGIGVVGMGWMGEAHSRSYRLVSDRFVERGISARLVACADADEGRAAAARARFWLRAGDLGLARRRRRPGDRGDQHHGTQRHASRGHPGGPRARQARLCEKPVGRNPDETLEAAQLARASGLVTFVGYNYRWAPVVQHAANLIAAGALGPDPLPRPVPQRLRERSGRRPRRGDSWPSRASARCGPARTPSTWRTCWPDPSTSSSAAGDVHRDRPLPRPGGTHYDTASADDPRAMSRTRTTSVAVPVRRRRAAARSKRAGSSPVRSATSRSRSTGPRALWPGRSSG